MCKKIEQSEKNSSFFIAISGEHATGTSTVVRLLINFFQKLDLGISIEKIPAGGDIFRAITLAWADWREQHSTDGTSEESLMNFVSQFPSSEELLDSSNQGKVLQLLKSFLGKPCPDELLTEFRTLIHNTKNESISKILDLITDTLPVTAINNLAKTNFLTAMPDIVVVESSLAVYYLSALCGSLPQINPDIFTKVFSFFLTVNQEEGAWRALTRAIQKNQLPTVSKSADLSDFPNVLLDPTKRDAFFLNLNVNNAELAKAIRDAHQKFMELTSQRNQIDAASWKDIYKIEPGAYKKDRQIHAIDTTKLKPEEVLSIILEILKQEVPTLLLPSTLANLPSD